MKEEQDNAATRNRRAASKQGDIQQEAHREKAKGLERGLY